MLEVSVNDNQIPVQNIWYHKKSNLHECSRYLITLNLNDENIKLFLLNYIKSNEWSNEYVELLKQKEINAGSLGIIWHLIQFFDSYTSNDIVEDKTKPYYIFNTVDNISQKDNKLIISGRYNLSNHPTVKKEQ